MPALPGSHYCEKHQGNSSRYAPENCELCQAIAEVQRLGADLKQLHDEVFAAHHATCNYAAHAIGSPGCICSVENRYDVAKLRAKEERYDKLKTLLTAFVDARDVYTPEDGEWNLYDRTAALAEEAKEELER